MAHSHSHDYDHLLMIPGPIEVHEDVIAEMGSKPLSHVDPKFVEIFGQVLEKTRAVFGAPKAQPFVITASGTLGWEFAVANLLEAGQKALVPNTGYFSTRFADCLKAFGIEVVELSAPVGARVPVAEIEKALTEQGPFAMIGITHVDTSTGVRNDIEAIAAAVRKASPDTLIAVDGVCSIGGEVLKFDEWDVDFAFTGSQKALGCPPGLFLAVMSERAIQVSQARKTQLPAFYVRLDRWLPIMQAYEARTPSYFATPAVSNICALNVALDNIVKVGVDEYTARHRAQAHRFKACMAKLGLQQVALEQGGRANTLTALYVPDGIELADLLKKIRFHGVVVAGGLHPEIKTRYFRVGHMGLSVVKSSRGHINMTIRAIAESLREAGHKFDQDELEKAMFFTAL